MKRTCEIDLSLEHLAYHDFSRVKLFIATPMYGGHCEALYFLSMLQLQTQCLLRGITMFVGVQYSDALITRARNSLVDNFLYGAGGEEGFTHLLFIDGDINFRPADILQMIAFEKDVVCGPYPKKAINWKQVHRAVKMGAEPDDLPKVVGDFVLNTDETHQMMVTVPSRVRHGGTGMMLIRREVFERMIQAGTPYYLVSDDQRASNPERKVHAFFDTGIDKYGKLQSEDWYFCDKWRELGGEVWMLPWLVNNHVGSYTYSGDLHQVHPVRVVLQEEARAEAEKSASETKESQAATVSV